MKEEQVELEDLGEIDQTALEQTVIINREVFNDLQVTMDLSLGSIDLSVGSALGLKEGQVIELENDVSDSISLIFKNIKVAEGMLVAVEGELQFKITKVLVKLEI